MTALRRLSAGFPSDFSGDLRFVFSRAQGIMRDRPQSKRQLTRVYTYKKNEEEQLLGFWHAGYGSVIAATPPHPYTHSLCRVPLACVRHKNGGGERAPLKSRFQAISIKLRAYIFTFLQAQTILLPLHTMSHCKVF